MSIWGKLGAAAALPAGDWLILIEAWALLPVVDVMLRRRPFPLVQAWAGRRSRRPGVMKKGGQGEGIRRAERMRYLVDAAANNHLYRLTCLRRALVLQRLLGQRGIGSELRFGVQKSETGLEAHAWVEVEGQAVGEKPGRLAQFTPLAASEAVSRKLVERLQ
jgi:hypothetical protein